MRKIPFDLIYLDKIGGVGSEFYNLFCKNGLTPIFSDGAIVDPFYRYWLQDWIKSRFNCYFEGKYIVFENDDDAIIFLLAID